MWKGRASIQLQALLASKQPRYLVEDSYIRLLIKCYRARQEEKNTAEVENFFDFPPLILTKSYEHGFEYRIEITVYDSLLELELERHRETLGRFPVPESNDIYKEEDRFDVEL